jgi:hypothetical protein
MAPDNLQASRTLGRCSPDLDGKPLQNDKLWTITPGNGGMGGSPNKLYFTAGIGDEQHGLFGSIAPTTS